MTTDDRPFDVTAERGRPVGPIERFMTADHVEIDALLAAATARQPIDEPTYARFRGRLLRHVGMEEKVLLPFARERRSAPLEIAPALRADHGLIAKLLVRSPDAAIVDALRTLLGKHNAIEEGALGLYATCDAIAGDEAPALVERLAAQPAVPLAKYYDGPLHPRA